MKLQTLIPKIICYSSQLISRVFHNSRSLLIVMTSVKEPVDMFVERESGNENISLRTSKPVWMTENWLTFIHTETLAAILLIFYFSIKYREW